MSRYTNHPAYPVPAYPGDDKHPSVRPNSGMSMRDYFAGRALAALNISEFSDDEAAHMAYRLADAMMAVREERR